VGHAARLVSRDADSPDLRGPRGPPAGRGGPGGRRPAADLRGARSLRQPARSATPHARRAARRAGRRPHGALARDGGGPARRAEVRRGLRAARRRLSERPPCLHARGRRRRRRGHRRSAAHGAALHGARCVMLPPGVPTPAVVADTIGRHGITTLWLTGSLFNGLIEDAPGALAGLRRLLVGGEALSVPHVRRALGLLRGTQLINGY